jgi:hypothetical protein
MRSLRLAALFAVLLLSVAPGAALAADPSQAAATVEQARVERYWTADRMARAIPRDFVMTESGGSGSQHQTLAVAEVPGASWTTGGEILERSGKVFFSLASGDYVCSGSVIQDGADPAYSLVITAGHCVYDQAEGAFATNWVYVAEYDTEPGDSCATTTHGCWFARAFVARGEFVDEPDLTLASAPFDYAIAVVGPGGNSGTAQVDALGAYPIRTGSTPASPGVHVFGYPQAAPYDGDDLVYCATDNATIAFDTGDWGLLCNMTGGASGGPWLYGSTNPENGTGEVLSVSSYRILHPISLYGPRFDAKTQAVRDRAAASTPDAVGIDEIVVRSATPFTDIAGSPFESYIAWVYQQGITSGCSPTLYCPNDPVPRDQMASFLARALDLGGPAPNAFTDDNGNPHEPNINVVARDGIASGCGVNLFCPSGLVKRDQMASFLSRALDLSGPAPNAFTDDNGNLHEVNINLVAREGIASGCTATTYCPTANVTRGQMAAFLYRAFAP